MRILLIEDEIPAAKRLSNLLKEMEPSTIILDTIDSVETAVKWLKIHAEPDLIFMDIHLADGNSFLIFEQIELKCPIIFATAYDEYAIKAFKVNSIDYLLKPIDKTELQSALTKFKNSRNTNETLDFKQLISSIKNEKKEYKQRFLVRISDRLVPINTSDVCYFYAEDKMVFLQTEQNKYPIDFTLDQLEELLDPQSFFRINRKYFGQVKAISKIFNHLNGKLKLILTPSQYDEIYVSRERASDFKTWLER